MRLDETVRGLEVVLGGGQRVGDVRVPPGRGGRLVGGDFIFCGAGERMEKELGLDGHVNLN